MWDFLTKIADQTGAIVALMTLYTAGVGYGAWHAIQNLWAQNRELRDSHAREIALLRDLHARDVERLVTRLDTVQDQRVHYANAITREVVEHVEHTRNAVEKIGDTMEILSDLITRKG